MVRLRKDKWYSSEGQRGLQKRVRRQGLPLRRLAGLVGLLVMVLILMQYAADPEVYRRAFEKLGVPFNDSVSEALDTAFVQDFDSFDTEGMEQIIETRDFWTAVLADLPKTIQTAILRGRVSNQSLFEIKPKITETLSNKIERWKKTAELNSTTDATSQQLAISSAGNLTQLEESARRVIDRICFEGDGAVSSVDDDSLNVELLGFDLAVDAMARTRLRDASPWQTVDRLPLALDLLNVSAADSAAVIKNATTVEPIVLSQQPELYRGRLVRLRAKIARTATVESRTIASRRFSYQVVWVRPASGVAQPVCICVPISAGQVGVSQNNGERDSSDLVANSQAAKLEGASLDGDWLLKKHDDDSVEIDFVGVFYKRLAYQAQNGIEVAPVLVAKPLRNNGRSELHSSKSPANSSLQSTDQKATPYGNTAKPSSVERQGLRLLLAKAKSRWKPPTDQMKYSRLLSKLLQPAVEASDGDAQSLVSFDEAVKASSQGQSPFAPKFILQTLFQLNRAGRTVLKAIDEQRPLVVEDRSRNEIESVGPDSKVRFVRRQGTAARVVAIPLKEEDQQWFEQTHIYAVEFKDIDLGIVVCESIPSDWLGLMVDEQAELNSPIVVEGLRPFADKTDILLASAVQWRIDQKSQLSQLLNGQPAMDRHLASLAADGWNLSWRDLVRQNDRRSISSGESQAFYELLRISSQKTFDADQDSQSWDASPSKIPFMDMFRQPIESQLKSCKVTMRAIRIARVEVADQLEQRWLGADEYFVIDGIAQLGSNQQIVLKDAPGSDDSVKFTGQFPVTIATTQLPDWLSNTNDNDASSGNDASSDSDVWFPQRYVKVAGIYYRLWSFESDLKTEGGKPVRQTNPLIVATAIRSSTLIENQVDPWSFQAWKTTGGTIIMLGILPVAWLVLRNWTKSQARKKRLARLSKN